MRQPIRASQGFEKYHIKTRKRWFLDEMQWGVPCKELVALILCPTTPNRKPRCKGLPMNLSHLHVSCALVKSVLSNDHSLTQCRTL